MLVNYRPTAPVYQDFSMINHSLIRITFLKNKANKNITLWTKFISFFSFSSDGWNLGRYVINNWFMALVFAKNLAHGIGYFAQCGVTLHRC
jgi:hypothetical protein